MREDFKKSGLPRFWQFCRLVLCLGMICSALAAYAQQEPWTTPQTFEAALQQARPGDVITLAPGDYGALDINGLQGAMGAPITITGAAGAVAPRFGRMTLRNSAYLVLEGLHFDYRFAPGEPLNLRPFQIFDSLSLTIRNNLFDGDVARGRGPSDDGYGTAFGLAVRFSRQIDVEANEVRGFFRGFVITESQDVRVHGNDIHSLRMDGMNFAQVERVSIVGNHIHDFDRSLDSDDHADMIQFWTASTTSPSRDIVIRDNLLNSGQGAFTQSIFIKNERISNGDAGPEMYYENFLIEDNLIINAHLHGISVGHVNGLTIRGNTLVFNRLSQGSGKSPRTWLPQIRVGADARDVLITDNVATAINGFEGQSDWQIGNNLLVQYNDRLRSDYYGQIFGEDALTNPADPQVWERDN